MLNTETIWLVICCAGAIQSLFLSVFLLTTDRGSVKSNRLLGWLMLAISIRLFKSIAWYFLDIEDILVLNLGFAAHAFIGPVLLLYLNSRIEVWSLNKIWSFIILLPAFVVIVATPWLDLSNFWYRGGYHALLYETLIYIVLSGYILFKGRKSPGFSWIRNLYLLVTLFGLAYFTNYILGINSYITGPIVYSLLIYVISFTVFAKSDLVLFKSKEKYQNLSFSEDELGDYRSTIQNAMLEEKLYLDGDFNLGQLSDVTGIPKHVLSKVLSEQFEQNFNDFINSFRVEKAKNDLIDGSLQHLKIASIAFDCGFNSLSSFNAAFKKQVGKTPSAFRKDNLEQLA